MKNDRQSTDFAEDGSDLYPHFKITGEPFPRVLATRRFEADDAEYFGAFLPKTAVRITIDFLNRVFRLRTCDIPIDGSFPVPCTQYYLKRCVAPCVASLCNRGEYLERVALARLFLANQRGNLTAAVHRRITDAAETLDFESAAKWRDILEEIEGFWSNPRLNIWLDDTIDSFETDETPAGSFVYLVSQSGRNVLGRKVFKLPRGGGISPDEAVGRIISAFYRFHLPREIRIGFDFEDRPVVTQQLTRRFGRPAIVRVVRPDRQRITSHRALLLARSESELDHIASRSTPDQIAAELKRLFGLKSTPTRIEAFDVAHISGQGFAAAWAVWENGKFLSEEYGFEISEKQSETTAIADAVRKRLNGVVQPVPDIILLDGGRAQLNASRAATAAGASSITSMIGAVKPAGRHSSVAYFLTGEGTKIKYDVENPAQNMLRLLRDAAHDLSNRIHRDLRDLSHHYELAQLLPSIGESDRRKLLASAGSLRKIRELDIAAIADILSPETSNYVKNDIEKSRSKKSEAAVPLIVPIRYVAEGGDADDLIPIKSNRG